MEKSQAVRLIDVFALGPFMMWLGLREDRKMGDLESIALATTGLLTIVYNWRNYQANREKSR